MPIVSAWPLLDKELMDLLALDRGPGTQHTANPGAAGVGSNCRGGDPLGRLGEPVWVGADTAPGHPFLTLCV